MPNCYNEDIEITEEMRQKWLENKENEKIYQYTIGQCFLDVMDTKEILDMLIEGYDPDFIIWESMDLTRD